MHKDDAERYSVTIHLAAPARRATAVMLREQVSAGALVRGAHVPVAAPFG